jgi:hypothetical protein
LTLVYTNILQTGITALSILEKMLFYLEFQFGNSISRILQYIRAVLLSLGVCPNEGMHLQNMDVGIPMT